MGDWLRVYNAEDVVPFIEAFRKMSEEYCLDKIDVCKYAVGIPGISMTQVQDTMKQVLGKKELELYSAGVICHFCRDIQEELQHCRCNGALKCGGYCKEFQCDMQALEKCGCEKIVKDGHGRRASASFTRYHEKDITQIKFHVYGEKDKLIKVVIGYDANSLYLYCSGNALFQRNAGCE